MQGFLWLRDHVRQSRKMCARRPVVTHSAQMLQPPFLRANPQRPSQQPCLQRHLLHPRLQHPPQHQPWAQPPHPLRRQPKLQQGHRLRVPQRHPVRHLQYRQRLSPVPHRQRLLHTYRQSFRQQCQLPCQRRHRHPCRVCHQRHFRLDHQLMAARVFQIHTLCVHSCKQHLHCTVVVISSLD